MNKIAIKSICPKIHCPVQPDTAIGIGHHVGVRSLDQTRELCQPAHQIRVRKLITSPYLYGNLHKGLTPDFVISSKSPCQGFALLIGGFGSFNHSNRIFNCCSRTLWHKWKEKKPNSAARSPTSVSSEDVAARVLTTD